jgi:pimeloyl-ACP methyl ester carboxylesterase
VEGLVTQDGRTLIADRARVGTIAALSTRGGGHPIVLCHGNSSSSRSFQHQLEGELGRRHRLIAIDLPGHGDSPPARDPERGYTLPGLADALVETVAALGVADAVFVGWSLGGHVILEAADRLAGAAGLMIFGAPPVGRPAAADAFLPEPALAVAYASDPSSAEMEAFLCAFFAPSTPVPDGFRDDFLRTDPRLRAALAASIGRGDYRDEVRVVAELGRPLAILHGPLDRIVNRAYMEGLSIPALWRNEIHDVPGAGHTPQWENPAAFGGLLEEFVRDCTT